MGLGEVQPMALADWARVEACKDPLQAIILCVQLSGHTYEFVAEALAIDKGNFSRMMQGRANFPDRKRIRLMEVCRNYAPLQYDAWACNFSLVDKKLLTALGAMAA